MRIFLYFISAGLFLLSFILVKNDPHFNVRWLIFGIHILAFLMLLFIYVRESVNKRLIHKALNLKIIVPLGFILILTVFVSLYHIADYPFVSIADEVRDGGLDAVSIADGSIKNIWGYGRYSAHGLIIPAIGSFFYNIFSNTVLTYRLPAAILGCLDIVLIFILARLLMNNTAAFFSSLVLAAMPLHLFFTRTQIVVAFNFFWAISIMLSVYILFLKQRKIDYIILGAIMGLAFNFHAAVRVLAILVLLFVIFLNCIDVIRNMISRKKINDIIIKLILLGFFCLLGFGPRIFYTDEATFFHTSRIIDVNKESEESILEQNYLKSLMVWFYEPTSYWYPDKKPLFTPFVAIFFAIGLGYSFFFIKNRFTFLLIFLIFTIPLFNSALTDVINADHRINPILPAGAIFAGLGINYVSGLIKYKYLRYIFIVLFTGYLLWQINYFFSEQPANRNFKSAEYLSMHFIQLIKYNKLVSVRNPKDVCLVVSPSNYQNFQLVHFQEQYNYFIPKVTVNSKQDVNIKDNEAYIYKGTCPQYQNPVKNQIVVSCNTGYNNFYCPPDSKENIIFNY